MGFFEINVILQMHIQSINYRYVFLKVGFVRTYHFNG